MYSYPDLSLEQKIGLTMALNSHFEQQLTFPWIDQRFKQPKRSLINDLHSYFECFTIADEGMEMENGVVMVNYVPFKTPLLGRKSCLKCIQNDDFKWWIDRHNECATLSDMELAKVRLLKV